MSATSEFRIVGALLDPATGLPVPGLLVKAFDRDFFREQPLGEGLSGPHGEYEIRFGRDGFTGPLIRLEHCPDIFLRVFDPEGRMVVSTEESVVVNADHETRIDVAVKGWRAPAQDSLFGEPVDLAAAARLTAAELVQAYRFLRGREARLERPELVRQAFPGLFRRPAPWDDCAEGRLEVFRYLLKERGAFDADVGDADDFPAGTGIKDFFTANVWVRYTTDAGSVHAVGAALPAADAPFALSDGTVIGTVRANLADLHADNTEVAPAYVQKVGIIAEHALSRFVGPQFGFRDPRNGAARMEYRVLEQGPGLAGGTRGDWSHVEVDPGNGDLQNLHTIPHEMFHQVQYRYNDTVFRSGIYGALREGGARLIEDCINDQPNRWALQAQQIMNGPGQSLLDATGGPSTPINYAAGLFWKYLAEQHSERTGAADEPAIGVDAYRRVLEASATVLPGDPGVGYAPSTLRTARRAMPWYGSFDEFHFYDAARTELGSNEVTWGNYLLANFLHGTANPVADRRFEYMEDEHAVTFPAGGLAAVAKLAVLQAAVAPGNQITLAQGTSTSRMVPNQAAYSATYFRITPGAPAPRMLRVDFTAAAALSDPLVHVVRLGPGSALVDVHRSDATTWSKTIHVGGLESVVVIVSARTAAGGFTVQFDEVASATDVMATRWNSVVGTEYEVDPRGWAWTWVSPDVMVDTDDDLLADTEVLFGVDNKLKVRLRNRGNAAADDIQVEFWYQKATPFLTAAGWIPVQDAALVTQVVTGESLAPRGSPGDEKWVSVNWAPVDDGTHHPHWCVKVRITVPGDPNADNKVVLSNFGNVVVDPDGDGDRVLLLLRSVEGRYRDRLHVLPRGTDWTFGEAKVAGDPFGPRGDPPHACACGPRPESLLPTRVSFATLPLVRAGLRAWDGVKRTTDPEAGSYYPVRPDTLPPGVDPASLVTVAHLVDGRPVGGMTYRVVRKD